jgi:hypothetical protein
MPVMAQERQTRGLPRMPRQTRQVECPALKPHSCNSMVIIREKCDFHQRSGAGASAGIGGGRVFACSGPWRKVIGIAASLSEGAAILIGSVPEACCALSGSTLAHAPRNDIFCVILSEAKNPSRRSKKGTATISHRSLHRSMNGVELHKAGGDRPGHMGNGDSPHFRAKPFARVHSVRSVRSAGSVRLRAREE